MPGIPKNYKAKQGQMEFYQGNGDSSPAKKKAAPKKNGKKAMPAAAKKSGNNSTRTSFMNDMYKGMRGQ